MNNLNLNEEALVHNIERLFSEYDAETHGYLRIGIIGKVSSGKSSFLNAFFDYQSVDQKLLRSRSSTLFPSEPPS